MPRRLFAGDVAKIDASFKTVATLASAEMYDVSFTAAAWRLTETTRESCALVVSTDGVVEWVVCSDAWRYPLAERRRPLPGASMAAAVVRGEAPSAIPESVDPTAWLASSDGRVRPPGGLELLESTHAIPRLNQVLSLLWAVEDSS